MPLGAGRSIGLVLGHPEHSEFNLRDIIRLVDESPLLSQELVEIGQWMANYYHYPIGMVFQTMLPHNARVGRVAEAKPEQQWQLAEGHDQIELRKNAKNQLAAYDLLKAQGQLTESMLVNLEVTRATLDSLVNKGMAKRTSIYKELRVFKSRLNLSREQQTAVDDIKAALDSYATFLIDGITGSGKTEVYLQVIDEVIRRGQQVLVLLPEIGLTPQMTTRFNERFSYVEILHSMITNVNRFRIWIEAKHGLVPIVIGTRSAVFTPFDNLGLIVVDEEHDASFKQSESLRYSARDIAIMRASKLGIPCILGSATPSLESVLNARRQRYKYHRLSHRPGTAQLPSMHIQDIRRVNMSGGLCESLMVRIAEHLDRLEQVLVLINRRGHSTQCFCSECGWIAMCADCDVKLTWHHVPIDSLQCHTCGRKYQSTQVCPACKKESIVMLGYGTQQVEETLKQRFSDVKCRRVDRDAFKTNRQLKALFEDLESSQSGLLIGTQMLSKGHHLPNVTLVVVLGADNGFLSTDFKGSERTAQLIVQVAGRAGRSEKRGEVWIQSYDPEQEDLVALVENGYEGFIKTELEIRKEAELPPYGYMAVIRTEAIDPPAAEAFCQEVLEEVAKEDVIVLGPADAPIARVAKQHRFQGVVMSQNRRALHRSLERVKLMKPQSKGVRWSIDVDPADMY